MFDHFRRETKWRISLTSGAVRFYVTKRVGTTFDTRNFYFDHIVQQVACAGNICIQHKT